jgi:hypothetical protein
VAFGACEQTSTSFTNFPLPRIEYRANLAAMWRYRAHTMTSELSVLGVCLERKTVAPARWFDLLDLVLSSILVLSSVIYYTVYPPFSDTGLFLTANAILLRHLIHRVRQVG